VTDQTADSPEQTVSVEVLADIPWYGETHLQGSRVELTIKDAAERNALEWLVASNRVRIVTEDAPKPKHRNPPPLEPHHNAQPKSHGKKSSSGD
jgi:hypothetical protein